MPVTALTIFNTKQNIDQLTVLVKTRLRRIQCRPGLLSGFLASTGLDPVP